MTKKRPHNCTAFRAWVDNEYTITTTSTEVQCVSVCMACGDTRDLIYMLGPAEHALILAKRGPDASDARERELTALARETGDEDERTV